MPYFSRTLLPGKQAEEALGRHLGEVVALDPHHGPRPKLALAQFGVLRMGRGLAGFAVWPAEHLGPVGQLQRQRVEHRHRARRLAFQVGAQRAFEHAVVDPDVGLAGAGVVGHCADAAGV
jgi:hypothetical protein